MPTYDYKCEKCGQVFEVTHGFDEDSPDSCLSDSCDGTLRRVFSPPTIIFKGSGWHVNDYGRNGNGDGVRNSAKAAEEAVESAEE